ncbi:MAG: tail-specific protease [Chitinophagia bacterium]|nr:tail-specific protease [Chitinophagia bacterium]
MLRFMKNKILIPLLIVTALAAFFSFRYVGGEQRSSVQKRKLVLESVLAAVEHDHFSPRPIDDTFSSRIYHMVLNQFDISKIFLTAEDVKRLSVYEFKLDDQIKAQSFEFFDSFDAIYERRIAQTEQFYKGMLETPFTFTGNETVELDPQKDLYAANDKDLQEKWRKLLKYRTLEKYVDLKNAQDKKKLDSPLAKMSSDAELEAQAREDIKKTYVRVFKNLRKFGDDERFTYFINAIVENQDPHTTYLPPEDKKGFEVMMSGSFFGIGAQLRESPDGSKITIVAIITGSPAWKQGELKADDEILKVAQGSGTPVDVQGYEINDVIKLIRGEKNTEVRLTVKRPDGTIKVIPIIRDVVKMEETFAKSAIINSPDGKVGYIYLPEFYADFNHTSGRRCAIDILEEVKKLKAEGVSGIILDLRGNGGGSLGDVVEMAGIFVGRGPVVQVKESNSSVNVLRSQITDTPVYSGPFAIMVNEGSASASEIMAAAMQDYRRAIIVGAPTFGKGTVQKMVPLDDIINPMARMQLMRGPDSANPGIGSLKLTMEKFYRVSGGSTQLRGVTPDIILPEGNDYIEEDEMGERKSKAALQYDEIAPARFTPANKLTNLQQLVALSRSRVDNNPVFKTIVQYSEERKRKMDDRRVSLNEKKYRKDLDENNAISKKLDSIQKKSTVLETASLIADKERFSVDSATFRKNADWLKNLGKDIYIAETVNIVDDMIKSTYKVTTGMK